MKPVSFILIEDHTLFRDSVAEALEDSGRYQCVGSFSTMEETLYELANGLLPDLVLLDLGLPGMSGLEGIGQIREKLPLARVFILTAFHDREKVFAALKAGAHGYLIKTGGALKVLRTLDDVAEGGVPLDPQIAGMVLQAFQQIPHKRETITPISPPSGPSQWLFQKAPAKSKFLAPAKSKFLAPRLLPKTGIFVSRSRHR